MQTCSNCGASVRMGARFCTACGTQLNDASPETSAFSWGAPVDEPVADAASSAAWQTESADEPDEVASETQEPEAETADESFTWSWNAPTADADPAVSAVDDESGIVIDESPAENDTAEVVDATEIDILAADASSSDSSVADAGGDGEPVQDPVVVSEEDLLVLASDDDQDGDTATEDVPESDGADTLAAWATSWSSDEDDIVALEGFDTSMAPVASEAPAGDDEDTVAKAERLIAELQSMLPRLVTPKPARPQPIKPQLMLAEELDSVDDGSDWSDLRELLERIRESPRDVEHMMNLSSNAERLIGLLDQRDTMASTAARVASRLRNPEPADEE